MKMITITFSKSNWRIIEHAAHCYADSLSFDERRRGDMVVARRLQRQKNNIKRALYLALKRDIKELEK